MAEGARDRAEGQIHAGGVAARDLDNARGWYTWAERPFPGGAAAPTEIAAARRAVESAASRTS